MLAKYNGLRSSRGMLNGIGASLVLNDYENNCKVPLNFAENSKYTLDAYTKSKLDNQEALFLEGLVNAVEDDDRKKNIINGIDALNFMPDVLKNIAKMNDHEKASFLLESELISYLLSYDKLDRKTGPAWICGICLENLKAINNFRELFKAVGAKKGVCIYEFRGQVNSFNCAHKCTPKLAKLVEVSRLSCATVLSLSDEKLEVLTSEKSFGILSSIVINNLDSLVENLSPNQIKANLIERRNNAFTRSR